VPRWIGATVALAAVVWVVALAAAPLLPAAVATVLYAAGAILCHQIPERSFYVDAFQLPVCARCFGLYAGGAAGSVAAAALAVGRRLRTPRPPYAATVVAALPTLVTLIVEWGFGWPVSNAVRALAALPLAAIVAFVVVSSGATLHYDECAPRRPIGRGQPPPPARI
jgi:uncharacterized membrane protein